MRPWSASTAGAEQPNNFKNLAYDGSDTTRWCNQAAASNAWIQLDLGAAHRMSKVRLMMENGHLGTYPIKIEVGNGTTFTTAFTGSTSIGQYKAFEDFSFGALTGRYVRISMTGNNSFGTGWFSTWEIQTYGTP
jgi:hypothetical protein